MKQQLIRTRSELALSLALGASYFFTRLTNLDLLPIFTDEAIYVRWSQIGSYDAAWRFIPLTDGKPPLYHWILMVVLRFFSDPLLAGRLVSVFAGFTNLALIGLLGGILFKNRKVGYLAAFFYLISPFAVVYDRLAIVDALLTTFSIASLLLAVLLVRTLRFDVALILAVAMGAGLLTKASGLLFLVLTPLTLMLANWPKTRRLPNLFRWLVLLSISVAGSQVIYAILRLSQFFYRIEQKNDEFLISFSDFLSQPFMLTWGNLKSLVAWQVGYLTLPFALLLIFTLLKRRSWRRKLLLVGYYLVPLVMIASFNKIIFPRFLLFSFPFLLVLAAQGFLEASAHLRSQGLKTLLLVLVAALPALTSLLLITDPLTARIPQADRDQYLDSWPAGWGIRETVAYLKHAADSEPIFVGTQGTFGLMPYALEIYLHDHPHVAIQSFWPVEAVPDEVLVQAETKPTYFIYNELEDIPPQTNLELILEFEKRRGDEIRHMRLFKVLSESR